MSKKQKASESQKVNRRTLVRKGLKAAYVVPAVMVGVKALERPAYGFVSGGPAPAPAPVPQPLP